MSSAVDPGLEASCNAWPRGGEGWSSQRREVVAVAYLSATGTCSVKPSTMRWFSPSRSQGNVGFRLWGVKCHGAFGSRRGVCRLIWWASVGQGVGGAPLEGGRSKRQVFDKVEWYGVVVVRRGQEVGVWVPRYSAEVYAPL